MSLRTVIEQEDVIAATIRNQQEQEAALRRSRKERLARRDLMRKPTSQRTKKSVRCADWWERKHRGLRYVSARGQCKRPTAHPSGYCKAHRHGYRWSDEQERAYQDRKQIARDLR